MGDLWTWIGAVKGETWGAFAGALVVFVIKVVGPLLTRAVTQRFVREVQELEKLAENEHEDPRDVEIRRLSIELGIAKHDLDGVAEDLRKMANRNAMLEDEIERWKRRAAAEAARKLEGGKDADAATRGSRGAERGGGPGGIVGRPVGRADSIPTLPPARRPRRPDE